MPRIPFLKRGVCAYLGCASLGSGRANLRIGREAGKPARAVRGWVQEELGALLRAGIEGSNPSGGYFFKNI